MVCWNIDHFFFDDFRSYFETSMFSSSIKEKNTSCLVRASQNTWICRRSPPKDKSFTNPIKFQCLVTFRQEKCGQKNHPNSSLFRILHPLESMKKTPPPIKSLRFPLNRIGRNLFRLDFLLNSIGKIIIKNTCPINSFSYRFPVDFVQRDSSGPGFSIQASAALILAPAAVAAFSAATR